MAWNTGVFVGTVAQIPEGEHWAILEQHSMTIPGDERSRQAPGHGYPEHTETFIKYRAFTNEAEFLAEVQRKSERVIYPFRAIHVTGDRYVTRVVVEKQ